MSNFNINSVKLNHYSDEELKFSNCQYTQPMRATFKPKGFWLSFDDQWLNWCLREEYNIEKIHYCTEFKIKNTKNFVILDSSIACIQFQEDYGSLDMYIKWDEVAKEYDGIVFTYGIYNNMRRRNQIWKTVWSAWDIESVCVWNTNLIKPVKTYPIEIS